MLFPTKLTSPVKSELKGKFVNPDPSPTKAVADMVPAAVVSPLNMTLNASLLDDGYLPFPMTKAVLLRVNEVAFPPLEIEDPALLKEPIINDP